MNVRDRDVRLATWLAPLGWFAAAVCLGLWVVAPTVLLDPRTFAWGTAFCVVFAALGHLAVLHRLQARRWSAPPEGPKPPLGPATHDDDRGRPTPTRRLPVRHQGRSHSGARPRFD
jgi:hypothetical protein